MQSQNATKSIIYGNIFQNKYGKFMPICASILDRASITNIIDYLKQTAHFKKFNRVAYAYRVDQMPVVFITQKKNIQTQYYQGCHSDQTIQGSGQKLLHLLQKFNIRNVLIAVLIQQFHPLLPFQSTNYRAIVQNSRMLLDQLYKKVMLFQQQNQQKNINDLLLNQEKVLKMKKIDLSEEISIPVQHKKINKQRPNYVYNTTHNTKPVTFTKTQKTPLQIYQQQLNFLWQRCNTMKVHYKKITQSLQSRQLDQLKYFIMYDKNSLINIVIQMFTIFINKTKEQIIEDYDLHNIKKIDLEVLGNQKLKKLDQIIKINKKINIDGIIKVNRALGMIFSMIESSIKKFQEYGQNFGAYGQD